MYALIKKISILCCISLFLSAELFSQDPEFSMFYAAPVYLNPAMAGTGKCARTVLNFRDQWPGVNDPQFGKSHAYQTYAASYDQYFDKIWGGIGVQFIGDQAGAGVVSTHSLSAMYAYRVRISENFNLQAALEAGFYQKSIDWQRLVFEDQLDPRYGLVKNASVDYGREKTIFFPDFSAGIFAYSEKLYGGFAVKHLTQPNESFTGYESRLPMRFTFHGGTVIQLRQGYENSSYISPDILYTHQKEFKQLNLGLFWSNDMFFAGMWGRLNFGKYNVGDALIPRVGFKKDFFQINYSYDFTLSGLNTIGQFNAGAHEVALQFNFCPKQTSSSIYCPRF